MVNNNLDQSVDRFQIAAGWYIIEQVVVKLEYVKQNYDTIFLPLMVRMPDLTVSCLKLLFRFNYFRILKCLIPRYIGLIVLLSFHVDRLFVQLRFLSRLSWLQVLQQIVIIIYTSAGNQTLINLVSGIIKPITRGNTTVCSGIPEISR